MPDTAINILWTIGVGTFVLLLLAVGFIMAIVQSKQREDGCQAARVGGAIQAREEV